jgi:lysine 2,3-aminomutase
MVYLEDEYWKNLKPFENISKSEWENWKWQISNRIVSINDLEKFFSLDKNLTQAFLKTSSIYH